MHNLPYDPGTANRPLFQFSGQPDLPLAAIPVDQLTLSGPSEKLDPARCPVRGDLAHIALAGRVFVPHYAVPMPHSLKADAVLRKLGCDDSEAIVGLAAGAVFDVLDMSGGWAWGQVDDGGLVGYLPLDLLVERRD